VSILVAENKNELGVALKELRLQNGMSQADVADKIGVSQGTYFRIENGMVKLHDSMITKLANAFGISPKNLRNYGDYKKAMSLGHLKDGAMEFVLDPRNAVFIQGAILEKQIIDLMKQKEDLYKNISDEDAVDVTLGTLVRPITKLFDEELMTTDIETVKTAIEQLKELRDGCEQLLMNLDSTVISGLEDLLESALESKEPIDGEELLDDVNSCIESLREI